MKPKNKQKRLARKQATYAREVQSDPHLATCTTKPGSPNKV
jgi:hypothetical protein